MNIDLLNIARQFALQGEIGQIKAFGSGHIHDTYLIKSASPTDPDYILQRLNTNIFKDFQTVMHNIHTITHHILNKLKTDPYSNPTRNLLNLVLLKNGREWYMDEQNQVWRVFLFIDEHQSFDKAGDPLHVYEGGKAFGKFLFLLSDLPTRHVGDTIPDFHNIDLRIRQFEEALQNGNPHRIQSAAEEITFLSERKKTMRQIRERCLAGHIPLRLVHHDTKINNVLFDLQGKALCVIDLDTVMPGYVHDDFGDAIRTFTNTGEEDDADLSKISMNIDYFRAFSKGYLEMTGSLLRPIEKEFLPLSARVMTYMQSIRFLTDYLNNDSYYKIHHKEHNLQRTRAQVTLLKSMEDQYDVMCDIISSIR